jgi:hypothetical protein
MENVTDREAVFKESTGISINGCKRGVMGGTTAAGQAKAGV